MHTVNTYVFLSDGQVSEKALDDLWKKQNHKLDCFVVFDDLISAWG